jgi:hypothetical protein
MGTTANPHHDSLADLERVAEEIRVKIHLAGMDAKDTWSKTLEPKIFEIKERARQAGSTSRDAVRELVERLEKFYASL